MALHPFLAGLAPTRPGEILREDVLPAASNASEFGLNLQRDRDLRILERRMAVELAAIPTRDAA